MRRSRNFTWQEAHNINNLTLTTSCGLYNPHIEHDVIMEIWSVLACFFSILKEKRTINQYSICCNVHSMKTGTGSITEDQRKNLKGCAL